MTIVFTLVNTIVTNNLMYSWRGSVWVKIGGKINPQIN